MTETAIHILLIEDDPAQARLVQEILSASSRPTFHLIHAERLDQGLDDVDQVPVDVILLDLSLPDSRGLDTIEQVYQHCPDIPIVVLTGLDDEQTGLSALQAGAQDYLIKGECSHVLLARTIRYAIERKRAQREREKLIRKLQAALDNIKILRGLLPICAHCKKIRDDQGYWRQVEEYIREHSEAEFSHGLCPECAREHYADLFSEEELEGDL